MQITNYYPFGGILNESFNRVDYQNKLYNGKELDRMHGLNLYDYSARQYDAALGQFTSMDPLCEKYYHISPYAYCAGNPVKYTDPNGDTILIQVENITYRYHEGTIYSSDGNVYPGKIKGYLKHVLDAIGDLNKTDAGSSLVSQLDASKNTFTIMNGEENAFKPNRVRDSYANLNELKNAYPFLKGSNGSGGIITWNPMED